MISRAEVTCSRPGWTARLPELRTLDLQVHAAVMHHFFLHFVFPSTADLTLHIIGAGTEGRSLFAQSDAVESVRQSTVKADFTFFLEPEITGPPSFALRVMARDAAEDTWFVVGYSWFVPTVGPLGLSHVDLEIYRFCSLTELSIEIESMKISRAQWASVLSDLVRLTTMQVQSSHTDLHLVQGLAMERPLDGGLLCPALVEMHIHCALCGEDRSESTLQSALDALEHRALLGCPLSTLSIVTAAAGALASEYITRLRRVVAEVEQAVGYVPGIFQFALLSLMFPRS